MAVMRATQTAAVAVVTALGEQNMPHVIAVGTRSPASLLTRITESLLARLLWISGRVPHGVTPTLGTSRWWR
jgi:NaMN:DMB phosphoribosyltransferase